MAAGPSRSFSPSVRSFHEIGLSSRDSGSIHRRRRLRERFFTSAARLLSARCHDGRSRRKVRNGLPLFRSFDRGETGRFNVFALRPSSFLSHKRLESRKNERDVRTAAKVNALPDPNRQLATARVVPATTHTPPRKWVATHGRTVRLNNPGTQHAERCRVAGKRAPTRTGFL